MVVKRKTKAILFGFKRSYINASHDALMRILETFFDLTFYGPGYTDAHRSEDDLYKAFLKEGTFEAAFIYQQMYTNPHDHEIDAMIAYQFEHNTGVFPESLKAYRGRINFGINFDKIPAPKFLILSSDPYTTTSVEAAYFRNFPGYIIGIPTYFIETPKNFLKADKIEKFPSQSTPHYHESIEARGKDLIPYCHALLESEFSVHKASPKYDITVPGVLYYQRRKILEKLYKFNLKVTNMHWIQALFERLYYKVFPFVFVKKIAHYIRKKYFIKLISSSQCAYTCGSMYGFFVRKFIEIPALKTVLLCSPFANMERAGFIEGKHYIKVDETNIIEKFEELKRNPAYEKYLVENAYQLVTESHSVKAWENYFPMIWESIQNGTFKGCEWKEGKVCLL